MPFYAFMLLSPAGFESLPRPANRYEGVSAKSIVNDAAIEL